MAIIRNILDSRIKDCSDIQSFKQYDDKYIGESGYFSDSLCRFQDLKRCYKYTLININDDGEADDFIFESKGGNYRYFLPEKLLKSVEKKYRPYTIAEWVDQHGIGDVVIYRSKKAEGIELHHMYVGYACGIGKNINEIGVGTLTLGVASYSFDYLFEDFELFYNGRWMPFGIEVEK